MKISILVVCVALKLIFLTTLCAIEAPELKIWPSNAELRNRLRESLEQCSEPRRDFAYGHRNRPNDGDDSYSSRSERKDSNSNKINHFLGLSYDLTSVRDYQRNSSGRYYRDNRTFSSFTNTPMDASIHLYKNFTHPNRDPDKDFENSKTKAFTNSTQNMQSSSQSDSTDQNRYNKYHGDFKRSLGSRSITNKEMSFQGSSDSTQDFSGNFKNYTGAVVGIERSHERESSRGLFEEPTRLRHTGRGGGNMKEQIFGYRPDPYHRSHRNNSDDERQRGGSNDETSNARNNKSYRRNPATVSSSTQNQGLRDQFLEDPTPRRIPRETYNSMSDTMPACTVQCIFTHMEMVNEKGFPEEQRTLRILQSFVNGDQEQTAAVNTIKACFQQLISGLEEDNCEFAVKLASCIKLDFQSIMIQES